MVGSHCFSVGITKYSQSGVRPASRSRIINTKYFIIFLTQCLANGFRPQTGSLRIQCDQGGDSGTFLGSRGCAQLRSHGGGSSTRIPSTLEQVCTQPAGLSCGPLCASAVSGPVLGVPPLQSLLPWGHAALQPCACRPELGLSPPKTYAKTRARSLST